MTPSSNGGDDGRDGEEEDKGAGDDHSTRDEPRSSDEEAPPANVRILRPAIPDEFAPAEQPAEAGRPPPDRGRAEPGPDDLASVLPRLKPDELASLLARLTGGEHDQNIELNFGTFLKPTLELQLRDFVSNVRGEGKKNKALSKAGAAAGLFVTFVITLVTSDFKKIWIPKTGWISIFFAAAVLSFGYAVQQFWVFLRSPKPEGPTTVDELLEVIFPKSYDADKRESE